MQTNLTPQQKIDWVIALRSGNYPQTTGQFYRGEGESLLNKPEGYCCMGVLLKINGEHEERMRRTNLLDRLLPMLSNPRYPFWVFAEMNDDKKMTFPEIADWIEKNVKTI